MKNEYDEKALIKRAKRGDTDAFAQLVKNSERTVYALALRMSKNEQDALDISQEAYIRAWKSLSAFWGNCSFVSWIYKITRNAAMDFLKEESRHRAQSLTYETDDSETKSIDVLAPVAEEPEQVIEKKERIERLEEAIGKLPSEQREVLVLYDIEGYSYREICGMLGIGEGTLKSRLSRAREKIRKILKKAEHIK